ncbi:MAG: tetratricopeptide repeat protein [Geobacteraceae bacterium]
MRHFLMGTVLALTLIVSACGLSQNAKKQASYHYQMGQSYLAENNVPRALLELTEAEKIDPDNPWLLCNLGLAYFRKNKFDLAEQKYQKAIDLKPDYSEARNRLGVNYMEMKRWDDAIYQFKFVTEDIFFPDQEAASMNLGLAYFGKGDYPKALSVLRSVVNTYSGNPRGRLHLGRVYFALDKVDIAIAEYRKAIDIYGDYASAYYNLGIAYLKLKDYQKANSAFREVLRIAPDSELGQLSREYLNSLK